MYPITTSDLLNIDCENDEVATLVAIEALLDGHIDELSFNNNLTPTDIEEKLRRWDRFIEYGDLITQQKLLLNKPIISSSKENGLTDEQINKAHEISNKVNNNIRKSSRSLRIYQGIGVAATFLVLVFGTTSIILNSQTAGRKSSSTVSVDRSPDSSSDTNKNEIKSNTTNTKDAYTKQGGNGSSANDLNSSKVQSTTNQSKNGKGNITNSQSQTNGTANGSNITLWIKFSVIVIVLLIVIGFICILIRLKKIP